MRETILFEGIALLAAAAAVVLVAKAQSRHVFSCPRCGAEFHPRWTQLLFEVHAFSKHRLKCPRCHETDFCTDCGKRG